MITRLAIRNFRSIEEAELELARVNVLYGPTASGKSSVLYALLVLKNFVANPNRPADAFFDLGFTNLGGYEACVAEHEVNRAIRVACEFTGGGVSGRYSLELGPVEADLALVVNTDVELRGARAVALPTEPQVYDDASDSRLGRADGELERDFSHCGPRCGLAGGAGARLAHRA